MKAAVENLEQAAVQQQCRSLRLPAVADQCAPLADVAAKQRQTQTQQSTSEKTQLCAARLRASTRQLAPRGCRPSSISIVPIRIRSSRCSSGEMIEIVSAFGNLDRRCS